MTPQPKILLSSVFGPYAQDDSYGSRAINPMELYHNQVTRAQGPFSLRMFHRSWGLMMIQENLQAPSTLLDFPSREAFIHELTSHRYDIVGISSIIVNVGKAREMCRIVREKSPHSTIVVGGHVTAIPGIENMIDADHYVKGDGVSWMRKFVGEDPEAPVKHPEIVSGYGHRIMGYTMPKWMLRPAATIIPSVGCPMGCNFCTTSAFFGGKGRYLNFYNTGRELYDIMSGMEARLGARSFFMMDENFLLHRRRAIELLDLMKKNHKCWELYVFSSANAIRQYSMDELVELGVGWVWMGLESPNSQYVKLNGTDTVKLARELHSHGIKVLGSTIVGLEHHTPENITSEIEHAISHETDFHQFMLYTPVPGTPLHREMSEQNRLIDVDLADIHGQYKFNFQHQAISREESKRLLDWAFWRDFERNGPSVYRICKTNMQGWLRHRAHKDERVRFRVSHDVQMLKTAYSGILWAMERHLRETNDAVSREIRELRQRMGREFGIVSKAAASLIGPMMLWGSRREERRLAQGFTYEPQMVIDRRNW